MTITEGFHVLCRIRLNKQVITLRKVNAQVMNLHLNTTYHGKGFAKVCLSVT